MSKSVGMVFVLGCAGTLIAAVVTGEWRFLIVSLLCYYAVVRS